MKMENISFCRERLDAEPPKVTINETPERTYVFIRLNPSTYEENDQKGWQCDMCEFSGKDLDLDAIKGDPEKYYQMAGQPKEPAAQEEEMSFNDFMELVIRGEKND